MKLTEAQRRELHDLNAHSPLYYVAGYKPIHRLVELNLAETVGSDWYRITPAGRAALEREQ